MAKQVSRRSPGARALKRQQAVQQRARTVAFAAAGLAILGIAGFLVINPLRALRTEAPSIAVPVSEQRRIVVTMGGFDPPVVRVRAGAPFAVHLVNPDSQYHTDGGGWHQFRIEALNLDVRIPPKSDKIQTFAGLAQGKYEFYCDICCGGKNNPTMRGVLEVTG